MVITSQSVASALGARPSAAGDAHDDEAGGVIARMRQVEAAESKNPKIVELRKDNMLATSGLFKSLEDANAIEDGLFGKASATGAGSRSRRGSGVEDGQNLNMKTMFEAKKLGTKARRKVQAHTSGAAKVRTKMGAVSYGGFESSKNHGKERKKEMEEGRGVGHFTPKNQAYRPVGGDMRAFKKQPMSTEGEKPEDSHVYSLNPLAKVPTERERMLASDKVPPNSVHGYDVKLESYDELLLQVDASEVNEKMVGSKPVPRSLTLKAVNCVGGTPDIYITPDQLMDVWGLPRRDKCGWHTKSHVLITPVQQMYTQGVYYLRIVSGVEPTSFTLLANLSFYTPEIDKARGGPGAGYRYSLSQKRFQVGEVVHQAIDSSNQRRRYSQAGASPMSQIPRPSKEAMRGGISPDVLASTSAGLGSPLPGTRGSVMSEAGSRGRPQARDEVALGMRLPPKARISNTPGVRPSSAMASLSSTGMTSISGTGRQSSMLGSPSAASAGRGGRRTEDMSQALPPRPVSAMERAVDATFRKGLDKVSYDENTLELTKVKAHVLFSILSPAKFKYTHVLTSDEQEKILFGGAADDEDADAALTMMSMSSVPGTGTGRSGGKGKRGRSNKNAFEEDLTSKMKEAEPLSKKKYEYIEVLVPVAEFPGYAIISGEGVGERELLPVKPRATKLPQCLPGTAVPIQAGQILPDGADAVVTSDGVRMVAQNPVLNLLESEESLHKIKVVENVVAGQYLVAEPRPYLQGYGEVMPARTYIQRHFPTVLADYDRLYKYYRSIFHLNEMGSRKGTGGRRKSLFFTGDSAPGKDRRGSTGVAGKEAAGAGNDNRYATPEDVLWSILLAMEASTSPLLTNMRGSERKELAAGLKVDVVQAGEVVAWQGSSQIDPDAHSARCMYLVLHGELEIRSGMGEKRRGGGGGEGEQGRLVGTIDKPGSVFGESQMLFGTPWPATVRTSRVSKLAIIPISMVVPLIFDRPELLDNGNWEEKEVEFMCSANHAKVLSIMHDADAAVLKSRERAEYRLAPSAPPPLPPPIRRNISGASSPVSPPDEKEADDCPEGDAGLGRTSSTDSRDSWQAPGIKQRGGSDVSSEALAAMRRQRTSSSKTLVRERTELFQGEDLFDSSSVAAEAPIVAQAPSEDWMTAKLHLDAERQRKEAEWEELQAQFDELISLGALDDQQISKIIKEREEHLQQRLQPDTSYVGIDHKDSLDIVLQADTNLKGTHSAGLPTSFVRQGSISSQILGVSIGDKSPTSTSPKRSPAGGNTPSISRAPSPASGRPISPMRFSRQTSGKSPKDENRSQSAARPGTAQGRFEGVGDDDEGVQAGSGLNKSVSGRVEGNNGGGHLAKQGTFRFKKGMGVSIKGMGASMKRMESSGNTGDDDGQGEEETEQVKEIKNKMRTFMMVRSASSKLLDSIGRTIQATQAKNEAILKIE